MFEWLEGDEGSENILTNFEVRSFWWWWFVVVVKGVSEDRSPYLKIIYKFAFIFQTQVFTTFRVRGIRKGLSLILKRLENKTNYTDKAKG